MCKNERHLWIENIVESIYTTPFFSTSNVEMVEYVDPQKVVAKKKNNVATLESEQNENVLKMRIESFGVGRFKRSFS